MRRRSTVGGALEMFSLPLPLPIKEVNVFARVRLSICQSVCLLARLFKKACMDLDKMLRVDRYRCR